MRARYFEHKARRAWWSTHLEAWRRSGVTRTEYCRLHRLNKSTFDRWLAALNLLESAREQARKRRKRSCEPVSMDKRNKAAQAFWAMHVEALNWSGVSAKDYAAAHHISVYTLRTWRARLDAAPLQVDWRARLHPSALPTVSGRAKEPSSVERSVGLRHTASWPFVRHPANSCDRRASPVIAVCERTMSAQMRTDDVGTNKWSIGAFVVDGRAFETRDDGDCSAAGRSLGALFGSFADCCGFDGNNALDQPRSRSSDAEIDPRRESSDGGGVSDPMSSNSIVASFGISKLGASPFATVAATAWANLTSGCCQEPR
jgi:hypothetical protein